MGASSSSLEDKPHVSVWTKFRNRRSESPRINFNVVKVFGILLMCLVAWMTIDVTVKVPQIFKSQNHGASYREKDEGRVVYTAHHGPFLTKIKASKALVATSSNENECRAERTDVEKIKGAIDHLMNFQLEKLELGISS